MHLCYFRLWKYRWRILLACCLPAIILLPTLHWKMKELDYSTQFSYPPEVENFSGLVHQLRYEWASGVDHVIRSRVRHELHNCSATFISGGEGSSTVGGKCDDLQPNLHLLILVKSAINHTERRNVIRQTWGFEERFSDVKVRRLFLMGVSKNPSENVAIKSEANDKGDIVQCDFLDTYFNNTRKLLCGLEWAVRFCNNASYLYFADDDIYLSLKNLLRFIRDPVGYSAGFNVGLGTVVGNETEVAKLYSGYVFEAAKPLRFYFSKWYITVDEYAYDRWPPYVTAGSMVLSREVFLQFYFASLLVPLFRFDDIYFAIIAHKLDISPIHNSNFHMYQNDAAPGFKTLIAGHGYDDPKVLLRVWNEQKERGFA